MKWQTNVIGCWAAHKANTAAKNSIGRSYVNDLTLREATSCDFEFAYSVKKAAFREYVERVFGWDEEHQRKLHEKRFPSQTFQVIQLSGVDVGILSTEREADCLKVNQLYILPEHQDGGIGTACMKAVIDDPKNKYIRLQALKVNRRAIKFYTRLGFNTIGETETHVQMERRSIIFL